MRKCVGCGSILQSVDPKGLGYSPKEDQIYCERCFKLIHYGRWSKGAEALSQEEILALIKKSSATIALLVDIWQVDFLLQSALCRALKGKRVMIILTKVDTLPANTSYKRLLSYLKELVTKLDEIEILEIFLKTKGQDFKEVFLTYLKENEIKEVMLCGMVSVGKSTLINELSGQNTLTTAPFLGTTLAENEIRIEELTLIDTPGIIDQNSALLYVEDEFLKLLSMQKEVRPQVFQLVGAQSYFIDGLLRLDVTTQERASLVFYLSPSLKVHRTKKLQAQNYYERHLAEFHFKKELKSQKIQIFNQSELVIDGIGVMAFHNIKEAYLYLDPQIAYTIRRAVL